MVCEECDEFELRRDHVWQWAASKILATILPKSGSQLAREAVFRNLKMWSLMLGGDYKTHYQRHRDEWEKTGDSIELERMLRQVSDLWERSQKTGERQ